MASAAPEIGSTTELSPATLKRVSRRLLPFLALIYFFCLLDRVNVGFAALTMNKALGLTAAMFGMGAGIYWVGLMIVQVPSTMALAHYGARRVLSGVLISWGIVATAMALVQGPQSFYSLRLLLGLTEGGCWSAILLYLTYWFPESHRARINGLFMLALPVTNAVAAPISGALLQLNGLGGLPGWKWLFITEGVPSIVLGLIAIGYLTNRPKDAGWLSGAERDTLGAAIERERSTRAPKIEVPFLRTLANPLFYSFGLGWFGLAFTLGAISVWLPQIVRHLGFRTNMGVGFVTAIPFLGGIVGMLYWGRHSDRTQERVWHSIVAALVAGAGWVAAAFLPSAAAQMGALTVATLALYGCMCIFWALPQNLLAGRAAAVGLGMVTMLGNIGGFVAPIIFGKLKDATGNFKLAFISVGLSLMLSVVGIIWSAAMARAQRRAANAIAG